MINPRRSTCDASTANEGDPVTRHALPWQTSGTTEGERQRVLSKLEESGKDLAIVQLVANWESGFRPFILMADALLSKGCLDPAIREICVLRMASTLDLDYEWQEHFPMAERAGVSPEQRESLRIGGVLPHLLFDEEQLTAAAMVDTIIAGVELTPSEWDNACDVMGDQAALELVFAVAWWAGFIPILTRILFPLASPREG